MRFFVLCWGVPLMFGLIQSTLDKKISIRCWFLIIAALLPSLYVYSFDYYSSGLGYRYWSDFPFFSSILLIALYNFNVTAWNRGIFNILKNCLVSFSSIVFALICEFCVSEGSEGLEVFLLLAKTWNPCKPQLHSGSSATFLRMRRYSYVIHFNE